MSGKTNRKTPKCLNCGENLKASYDYCPQCGQENSDLQLTFLQMLRDFFANYFALDSRFGRSFKPFFLKPGFLTEEFMKGKRMSYANPIRLYIVISVIHFFVFSIYFNEDDISTARQIGEKEQIDSVLISELESEGIAVDEKNAIKLKFNDEDSLDISGFDITERLNIIQEMAKTHEPWQVYDSLNLENEGYLTQLFYKQLIKLFKNGESSLGRYFLKNIPILMFFLLPVYALILKLFFSRHLYINHVIHSFHIHSFVFFVLTIFWIYAILFGFASWPFRITILILFIYIMLSFRRTYHIGFSKSIFRVLWTGFMYSIVLSLSMVFTLMISFFLF